MILSIGQIRYKTNYIFLKKIAIRFCLKDLFLLKMSEYYQYVYLEITVSCYQNGTNYFLLVQSRHIPTVNGAS